MRGLPDTMVRDVYTMMRSLGKFHRKYPGTPDEEVSQVPAAP